MYEHAHLEQSFKQNNLQPDGKMQPLDDEFASEESKRTALKIRKTTALLVRQFQASKELQMKLVANFGAATKPSDFGPLNESFEDMKRLWGVKLTTPLEEVNSIKE